MNILTDLSKYARIPGAVSIAMLCAGMSNLKAQSLIESGAPDSLVIGDAEVEDGGVRVMSWNLEWQKQGAPQKEKDMFARVIDGSRADIMCFQEVGTPESIVELMEGVQGEFIAIMSPEKLDVPLHLAIVVRVRDDVSFAIDRDQHLLAKGDNITVHAADENCFLFPDPDDDFEFPLYRDVLHANIQIMGIERLFNIFSTHAKSRRGGRLNTSKQRTDAAKMLKGELDEEFTGWSHIMLCGDMNATKFDRSISVFTKGDQPLRDTGGHTRDVVSIGARDLMQSDSELVVVDKGSEARDLRGIDTNEHTGAQRFDMILVSESLGELKSVVYRDPAALWVSDHLPVVTCIGGDIIQFDPENHDRVTFNRAAYDAWRKEIRSVHFDRLDAQESPIQITQFFPNPEGLDSGKEWIMIENSGDEDVKLRGFRLEDRSGNEAILNNVTLRAGEVLTISVGGGDNELSLNNGGDTVMMYDNRGNLIDKIKYGAANEGVIFKAGK